MKEETTVLLKKSFDYENYSIEVFDSEGKILIKINKRGVSFLFNSKIDYSEEFNFIAESNSIYNTLTIFLENNREKTPIFRLPIKFIDEITKSIKIIKSKEMIMDCTIVFGSVAGFIVGCLQIKNNEGKFKEIYVKNFLSDLSQAQKMHNFSAFSSGTQRMSFEMEEEFLFHLIAEIKKEIKRQRKQFKNRTDYFQV